MKLIFLMLLLYLSVVDIIQKKIPEAACFVMGVVIMVWLFAGQALGWKESLTGAAVGIFLIAAAAVTRQSVGLGDGVVFLLSGLLLGFWGNVQLLLMSLFIELLFIAGWVLVKKLKTGKVSMAETMKKRIPFLPFICISYICLCVGVWGEIYI